jgi:hypothetical protein
MRIRIGAALLLIVCCAPRHVLAQGLSGHVSLLGDYLPNMSDTAELRARVFVEEKLEPSPLLRVTLSGFVEGLLARRPLPSAFNAPPSGILDTRQAAIARVQDANLELRTSRADLLAGFARIAWGKLDELQPTDVINPLDASRFFFEGRSEARLPVALVRGRFFITTDAVLEALYSPAFRRGRFDQLEEETSPFNVVGVPPAGVVEHTPGFGEPQGGVRLSATSGRVDWSVSGYRGFEPFGLFRATPQLGLEQVYPRFTMIGGDFETVRGEWGLRGEVAAFLDDSFQSPLPAIVGGRSFDAGVGTDRRAGDYRVSATVLLHTEHYDAPLDPRAPADTRRTDVSLIGAADRSFARERYQVRVFGVYNASESAAFARGIATAALRDDFALEGSAGWFIGDGRDLIGRLGERDFLYLRVKYYF